MINNEFERQDAFTAEMIAAFDDGKIPQVFEPYMSWKRGTTDLPSRKQAYEMMAAVEAIENPDEYITSIEGELANFLPILR